jgi:hypothetical protein
MQQDNVIIYGRLKKKFIAKISLEIIKQNNETVVIDILFDRHRHLSPFEGVLASICILPQYILSVFDAMCWQYFVPILPGFVAELDY